MTWQTGSKAKMESWNFVTTDMSLHFASSYFFFPLEHLDLLSTLKCGLGVFEKCYLWHFRYEILIWWTWTWNSLKNTWATEPLILPKILEIQDKKKVEKLRTPDKLRQNYNFKAEFQPLSMSLKKVEKCLLEQATQVPYKFCFLE